MLTIWKYTIPDNTDRNFEVEMPFDAQILTVQLQNERGVFWALVDPDKPLETRRFSIVGTGHELPNNTYKYIGTFQFTDQWGFVFHLLERV